MSITNVVFAQESSYTPFDKILLKIYSPDSNENHDAIDTIRVLISSSFFHKEFSMPETGLNTSIFEKEIRLSPDLTKFPGDVQTRRDDGLSVTFRIDSDTVVTRSIYINYHVGQVSFDKRSFTLDESPRIKVVDPDMNRNPDTIDTISARIWSTTDRGGLLATLRETGAGTGIFEEIINFTTDQESTGTRLRVTDGDTIFTKYTDSTLPPPAALAADGIQTVEVREMIASSTVGNKLVRHDSILSSELALLDARGEQLGKVSIGEHVFIHIELTNTINNRQQFVYIVQVKNTDGETISQSWLSSEIMPSSSFAAMQSWLPLISGQYTVQTFVWDSLDNPIPLSSAKSVSMQVS